MTTPRDPSALPVEPAPDRAHAAALAALHAEGPARPWQAQARALILAVAALTLVGGAVVAVIAGTAGAFPPGRVPVLVLLLLAQAVALWSAVSPASFPARSRLVGAAWLLVAGAAAAVLMNRGTVAADASAGWVCSLSHVSFGLAPLAAVVWALRDMAGGPRRALTAGLAVATVGLFWGEVACERDIVHVLVHHFGAAVALIGACVLLSRVVRRRTFAP